MLLLMSLQLVDPVLPATTSSSLAMQLTIPFAEVSVCRCFLCVDLALNFAFIHLSVHYLFIRKWSWPAFLERFCLWPVIELTNPGILCEYSFGNFGYYL